MKASHVILSVVVILIWTRSAMTFGKTAGVLTLLLGGLTLFLWYTVAGFKKESDKQESGKRMSPKPRYREGKDGSWQEVSSNPQPAASPPSPPNAQTVTLSASPTTYELPRRKRGHSRFLSKEETTTVAGHLIGGLVYVCDTVPTEYWEEPAVIYKSLHVRSTSSVEALGYWPGYRNMHADQRDVYLRWLSGDRGYIREIGYAFLYFYGFERYVLRDAHLDDVPVATENLSNIWNEIERLQSVFVDSRSFQDYSSQLLDVIAIVHLPERLHERSGSFPSKYALAAHYAIAQAASDGATALDADWAIHWAIAFGGISRTKALRENFSVYSALFRSLYEQKTGGGMTVPTCKRRLSLWVTAASRGLNDVSLLDTPKDWCDPVRLKRPLRTLLEIHEEVMPAVRRLSKAIARKDLGATLAAWPAGVPPTSSPMLASRVEKIQALAERHSSVPLGTIAGMCGVTIEQKATKAQLGQLADALSACGLCLVPDPRLTAASVSVDENVRVYSSVRLTQLSPQGQWLALAIQMGALLAQSDGDVHENERAAIDRLVQSHPNAEEREYLTQYGHWRLGHTPSIAGVKKQVDTLDGAQRDELAKILVTIAQADGLLPKKEIKQLEKLFSHLGLQASAVSQWLHSSAGITTALPPGASVSTDRPGKDDSFVLDSAALDAHAASTADVQDVLSKIFEESSDEEDPGSEITAVRESASAGGEVWHEGQLDGAHEQLATWLLTKDEWSMPDIEDKCRELGIMPAGALEAINEAAFETLGDSLLEIGDPVEVYRDVLPA